MLSQQIPESDFSNKYADEYCFPQCDDDTGEICAAPKIKTIAALSRTPRDVYLICTIYTPKNLNPNRSYIKAADDVIKKAEQCAIKQPNVSEDKFTRFFRIIATFAEWRRTQRHQTIIILTPPPLMYIAAWERAFAQVGLITAWIDENGEYAASQYSLAAEVKNVTRVQTTSIQEFDVIEQLEPSATTRLWKSIGKSSKALAAMRQKSRRLILKVEQKHKDRRFSLSMPETNNGWVTVRRLSLEEYEEWLDGESYDDAVARYAGGKTTKQELNELINEQE